MYLYVNGVAVDPEAPSISATDHGFTVGDGVFETYEIVEGRTFALDRHLDRLERSCAGLGLTPPDRDVVVAQIEELERRWRADDAGELGRLRVTWTAGPGPAGTDRTPGAGTLVLSAGPIGQPGPARVAVVDWTRNERGALVGLKTTSYAENVVALAAAKARGATEAILGNTRGELCEGTGSNVFIEADGALHTPPLSAGPLAGVTRDLLLLWAADVGIPVRETTMPLGVMHTTAHAALSSSTRGLVPVVEVDGRPLDAGPLTIALSAEFDRRRRLDLNP